jgi:hypothetical protein
LAPILKDDRLPTSNKELPLASRATEKQSAEEGREKKCGEKRRKYETRKRDVPRPLKQYTTADPECRGQHEKPQTNPIPTPNVPRREHCLNLS